MKRIGQRALSFFLLAAVMLILLTSCGGSSDGLAPTDKLVIYCPPTMNTEMKQAKAEFERLYPDIALDFVEFGSYTDLEAREIFRERLKTELLAGKGPDLVIFEIMTFDDLYKVLDAGVFYDLNNFIEEDEDFHADDYLTEIFDGGMYQGKRMYVPLTFYIYYLLTDSASFQQKGLRLPQNPTYADWSSEIVHYMETHAESEIQRDLEEWFRTFRTLFTFSGLQIIDYQTREIRLDSEELRTFLESYKTFYRFPNQEIMNGYFWYYLYRNSIIEDWNRILQGNQLYVTYSYLSDINNWCQDTFQKPSPDFLLALPQYQGNETIAVGELYAAINRASPNKQNAYLFFKTMLEMQAFSPLDCNTVNKEGIIQTTSRSMLKALEGETVEGYEEVRPLQYYRNYSNALMDIVYARMEPYFRDEKSYEDCLAELQSALELYINE